MKGIEPSYAAWEAAVLPLNYTRIRSVTRTILRQKTKKPRQAAAFLRVRVRRYWMRRRSEADSEAIIDSNLYFLRSMSEGGDTR